MENDIKKENANPDKRVCGICGAEYILKAGNTARMCKACMKNIRNIYKLNGKKVPDYFFGSICWDCKNAVPLKIYGKYLRGCSWSIRFKPVNGWIAAKKDYISKNKFKSQLRTTYFVAYCPEFQKG